MKTKILILSLISFFIFSCKSDDDSEPQQPETESYLTKITESDGDVAAEFTYYTDKKLKKADYGFYNFEFEYDENGRVSATLAYTPNGGDRYHYTYDESGRIVSFNISGQEEVLVSYSENGNYYQYQDNGDQVRFYLNESNQLFKSERRYVDNSTFTQTYFYEDGFKGCFHNLEEIGQTNFISGFNMIHEQYKINATPHPLRQVLTDDFIYEFENFYNDQNILERSVLNKTRVEDGEAETVEYIYHYSEL